MPYLIIVNIGIIKHDMKEQSWTLDVPSQCHEAAKSREHTAATGECTGKGAKPVV